MALDSRYMIAPSVQEYFVDKDTGRPLAAGVVTFFQDEARTIKKPVYQLTGSPPDYTYTPLPNPCTLSSSGTFQDEDGNDILPYYYPFDANGNIQLYYITVYSSGNVLQFTRQGWPNFTATQVNAQNIINYIPNGQFLYHENIPATSSSAAGQITQAITILGPGGWTFERPALSSATDFVTFPRFNAITDNPTSNPRFATRIQNTVPGSGDTFKDLRVKFKNVNQFASATQEYTLSFAAITNSGSSTDININVVKNFGTGGSSTTTTNVGTTSIGTTYTVYNIPFIFGTNTTDTLGSLDDDFVQVAISLPTNAIFDVSFTDFILTPDNVVITSFPQTTEAEMSSQSIAGWLPTPDPNGFDLYLPITLGSEGFYYDSSNIGKIYTAVYPTAGIGERLCDGSQYETAAYSADGIPNARLFNVLFNNGNSLNIPQFGTGTQYLTAYISSGLTNQLRITTNAPGAVTPSSDGAIPTTFAINNRTFFEADYGVQGFINGSGSFLFLNDLSGTVSGATGAGTSGFTIGSFSWLQNTSVTRQAYQVDTVSAGALAGTYWQFANTTTSYYMWFKVDGSGSDPAPGGTGIQLDLLSAYDATEVANQVRECLSGFHITTVKTLAASLITPGSYFIINTATDSYYVWYTVNGAGTDPAPSGKKGIKVAVLSTDTNAQVATKTQIAINSKYYAVPDYRGLFLRMQDSSLNWDAGAASRFSNITTLYGNNLGTLEYTAALGHAHSYTYDHPQSATGATTGGVTVWANSNTVVNANTAVVGTYESRPTNTYVNFFIKY